MPLQAFHPAVAAWFERTFPAPTEAQARAWPAIRAGRDTLVAAPTGSGKTLTAFLAAIDELVREALIQDGMGTARGLPDATLVVYVSPLKALSNDIHLNLEAPLAGIRAELARMGLPDAPIRTAVRTGDTPQAERTKLRKSPPHILVTTPESLYVLLGSESGRAMLAGTRTVIVDEIHAVAANKRGSHLALSLERLAALCGGGRGPTRIGLSATQKPIDEVARFLVGAGRVDGDGRPDCAIVDIGYARARDLALELPPTPLQAVMSNEQWTQVYARLADLVRAHRTTLVFVNTRRMAERAARHLGELLGKEHVAAHHGSLSRELRLDAEQRLKAGQLKVLVATASLELGIDIGDVDLVCQLGSPRSIAAFLQRVGRSGHHVGGTPRGRLFPQSRDDLAECAALLDAVRRGELDALRIPPAPLDVLAQQVVAEVGFGDALAGGWAEDDLYALVRRAWPYRDLSRKDFDAVVRMLAEGFTTRRGPRGAYLHRDAVNGRLRGRKGGRLTAVTSGGTIPDTGDYAVLLEPQSITIGNVNEDFAIESLAGDIFQLGNASYRILRVEPGRVRVEDAQGAPPSIPFWLGEAPGRSDELSFSVSRLREEIAARLEKADVPLSLRGDEARLRAMARGLKSDLAEGEGRGRKARGRGEGTADSVVSEARASEDSLSPEPSPLTPLPVGEGNNAVVRWLIAEVGLDDSAAQQLADYFTRQHASFGMLPTQSQLAMERFFDESGGTQLVIHSPYGSRINRAWGLALRKRFCRQFNFELQAAATEDAIVLSLSTSHSFPLADVGRYLHSATAQDVLVQALLDAPLFGARWRWNATNALALPRYSGGKKTPPQLQRMRSEDLLATVFPDQVACAENLVGEREVPDHPLVAQTLDDCLHEAMDAQGWLALLRGLESGGITIVARDLTAPSPFAAEALNARPYAFLDDAPLEERRTQAVMSRRSDGAKTAEDLGRLDPEAIEAVREQAWPQPGGVDEMHEALLGLGVVSADEVAANAGWGGWLHELVAARRATRIEIALCGRGASPDGPHAANPPESVGACAPPTTHAAVMWTCAERLPQVLAMHPDATLDPPIQAPADYARETWTAEAAAVELVRARLSGLGPTTVDVLACALALDASRIEAALVALEGEGYVMRGRFTRDALAGDVSEQWCERHLLARIHRYTLGRLRREIEPVAPRDFMRFLCDWQRVAPSARVSGPDALAGVLAQLEGFEAPASAWEQDLLRARVSDYSLAWLDELCTAGRIAWARLRGHVGEASNRVVTVRATPVVLLPRRTLATWTRLAAPIAGPEPLSSRAQRVVDTLGANGASFFDDLLADTRLLQSELEDALAESVARGRVHCDSFAGLRALLVPPSKRPSTVGRRGHRASLFGLQDAGRWTLVGSAQAAKPSCESFGNASRLAPLAQGSEDVEHVARILLQRYGVVFWRLLEREPAWLPPWRDLLRVFHRLEARGEIRGGRFVAGVSGEQFALPQAVGTLRQVRDRALDGKLIGLSAADPLNLIGTVLPGPRVPRQPGARLLLRDGLALATLVAGEVEFAADLPLAERPAIRRVLLREVESAPRFALPVAGGD